MQIHYFINVDTMQHEVDIWFEKEVKEAICVKVEKPSLTYNTVLSSPPRRFNNHSHVLTATTVLYTLPQVTHTTLTSVVTTARALMKQVVSMILIMTPHRLYIGDSVNSYS